MGLDFIRQRAKPFNRCWDRHALELAERTLFSRDPDMRPRTAVARTSRRLSADERVLVRCEAEGLTAYDGPTRVAIFVAPPPDLVAVIRETGGFAEGRVVADHGNDVVEVELC